MNEITLRPLTLKELNKIQCPLCGTTIVSGSTIIIAERSAKILGFVRMLSACCGKTISCPRTFERDDDAFSYIQRLISSNETHEVVVSPAIPDLDQLLATVGCSLNAAETLVLKSIANRDGLSELN